MTDDTKFLALPRYSEESETLPAQRFCAIVERFATTNKWSDAQKASNAIEALKGKAATWVENLASSEPNSVTDWNTFKPKFLKRWNRVRSTSERARLLFNLAQRSTETTDDFFDRVTASIQTVSRDALDSFNGDNKDIQVAAAKKMTELFTTYLYVNGLVQHIKEKVESEPDLDTQQKIVDRARAAEIGGRKDRQRQAGIASLEQKKNKENNEKNKNGNGSGNGNGYGNGKKGPKNKKQILCYNCREWGFHISRECTKPKVEKELAEMKSAQDGENEDLDQGNF